MSNATLAGRIRPDNPRHHLWNNNGTWWCHYTLHLPDFTKRRVRTSLATRDPVKALALRDALLREAASDAKALGPVSKVFCRIVGEERSPDGRTSLVLAPITGPREQKAARARYEAAMTEMLNQCRTNTP
jgi:hypothetical protein